ncbi:MAG: hypothetical protein WCD35_19660 [Mycobacteriales bacterium]
MTAPSVSEITDAAMRAWHVSGQSAVSLNWDELLSQISLAHPRAALSHSRVAMVGGARTLECVFDDQDELEDARQVMADLVTNGWSVNVLLPVALMGTAHDVLRGMTMKLHGAWCSEETIYFTSAETP